MGKTISFVNRKGGKGSSTLILSIGHILTKKLGYSVHFEDLDRPQCSLTKMVERLEIPNSTKEDADFVLIDNPPRAWNMELQFQKSDLIVVPSKCSPVDIEATEDFISSEIIPSFQEKAVLVFTMVRQTRLSKFYLGADYQPDIRKISAYVRESTKYAEFPVSGRLPIELENEISGIILELKII